MDHFIMRLVNRTLLLLSFSFPILLWFSTRNETAPCESPLESASSTSVINLTLFVQSFEKSNDQIAPKYNMTELFNLSAAPNTLVTFKELAILPDDVWNLTKYPNIFRTYPQDAPLTSIVEGIRKGLPVSHMPMYNHPLALLNTTKSVCTGHDDSNFVMVIKSGVLGWQERDAFREFMRNQSLLHPNFKVGYVFSLRLPRKHGGRYFDRDGHRFRFPGHTGDLMEKYSEKLDEVMVKIMQEIETYGDIVLGDYEDTYFNLTLKTITNLRWISKFCDKQRHDTFMLIDDDHRVNTSMLMHFLNKTSKAVKRNSIIGLIRRFDKVLRQPNSKWYIAKQDMPWTHIHPFPVGFAQFIGADVVGRMAIASAYTKRSGLPDDVYLGMLAFKLNISMRNEPTMHGQISYGKMKKLGTPVMVAKQTYFRT